MLQLTPSVGFSRLARDHLIGIGAIKLCILSGTATREALGRGIAGDQGHALHVHGPQYRRLRARHATRRDRAGEP